MFYYKNKFHKPLKAFYFVIPSIIFYIFCIVYFVIGLIKIVQLNSAVLGMDGPIDAAYEKSFNNLMWNEFSEDELNSAVTNFKQGSQKNIGGLYNRHPENPPVKKPSLLKGFYPLIK